MLAVWKLAPLLAAGNTVVIKPSNHASASIVEFMDVFDEAGVPPGVINLVTGYSGEIGRALVEDPRVAKVSFTGSTEAGRKIGQQAALGCKRVALELGGKSAQIVCEDASIENFGARRCVGHIPAERAKLRSRFTAADTRKHSRRFPEPPDRGDRRTAVRGSHQQRHPDRAPSRTSPSSTRSWNTSRSANPKAHTACMEAPARLATAAKRAGSSSRRFSRTVKPSMRIASEEIFGPVLSGHALLHQMTRPSGLPMTSTSGSRQGSGHRTSVGPIAFQIGWSAAPCTSISTRTSASCPPPEATRPAESAARTARR